MSVSSALPFSSFSGKRFFQKCFMSRMKSSFDFGLLLTALASMMRLSMSSRSQRAKSFVI